MSGHVEVPYEPPVFMYPFHQVFDEQQFHVRCREHGPIYGCGNAQEAADLLMKHLESHRGEGSTS